MRDTILAIDDVEPGLAKAVVKHSERLGRPLKGLVLVDTNSAVSARKRAKDTTGLFKEIKLDFDDTAELQSTLKKYNDSLLAATCRQESSLHSFMKAVPFMPYIKTPSESALLWSTEKHLMRDRMRDYDRSMVPAYRFLSEYDGHAVGVMAREFNFPVIVKPNGLAASILVSRCDTPGELNACLEKTFKIINDVYNRDLGRGRPGVLVEEMIQGEMYSTDAYVDSTGEVFFLPLVRVITAHSVGLEGFYSHSFVIPTGLTKTEVMAAQKVSRDALRALNLSSSTAHIELFQSPDGWKIIEVGPRIGGYREALYREAYGIDHYYNDLAIRMDAKPVISDKPIGHATSFNIYPDEEGYIEEITGLEKAKKINSLIDLKCYAQPGDLALFAGNGGRFVVDGTLSNKDPYKLNEDLVKIRQAIKIKVRPHVNVQREFVSDLNTLQT